VAGFRVDGFYGLSSLIYGFYGLWLSWFQLQFYGLNFVIHGLGFGVAGSVFCTMVYASGSRGAGCRVPGCRVEGQGGGGSSSSSSLISS